VAPSGGSAINAQCALSQSFFAGSQRGRRLDFDVAAQTPGVAEVNDEAEVRVGDEVERVDLTHPNLLGHHNRQNAMAAIAAAALCGLPPDTWRRGFANYAVIAHRMERAATVDGVDWINDTKATNVDAAVKAVSSFEQGVHLIIGGRGKGTSYAPLVEAARGRLAAVYTIGEEGHALAKAFAAVAPVHEAGDLETAARRAREASTPGETVLLAPACSSFDQFTDYVARGDMFRNLAKSKSNTVPDDLSEKTAAVGVVKDRS